jgi:hypothetical protein
LRTHKPIWPLYFFQIMETIFTRSEWLLPLLKNWLVAC